MTKLQRFPLFRSVVEPQPETYWSGQMSFKICASRAPALASCPDKQRLQNTQIPLIALENVSATTFAGTTLTYSKSLYDESQKGVWAGAASGSIGSVGTTFTLHCFIAALEPDAGKARPDGVLTSVAEKLFSFERRVAQLRSGRVRIVVE